MKLLGDFLSSLITKGGGNPAEDKYKIFFGNTELVKVEVPDEVATAIDNGLISLKDAKNNHPEIKNHYHKQALDGVDAKIEALFQEHGIDQATRDEILVERNTYSRVPLLINKLIALEQKKATANKPDLIAINKEKEELNRQILAEKQRADGVTKEYADKERAMRIQQKQRGLYAGVKTVYDILDEDTKDTTLFTLINKGLQDSNATFTLDESGNLLLQKKDGTNFFGDNNQQVNAKQFVEQILSRNKLVVATPAAGAPPAGGNNNNNNGHSQQNPPPAGGTSNGNGGNSNNGSQTTKDLLKESMLALETAQNVPIFGTGTAN